MSITNQALQNDKENCFHSPFNSFLNEKQLPSVFTLPLKRTKRLMGCGERADLGHCLLTIYPAKLKESFSG